MAVTGRLDAEPSAEEIPIQLDFELADDSAEAEEKALPADQPPTAKTDQD
jgi:hypothetical protein